MSRHAREESTLDRYFEWLLQKIESSEYDYHDYYQLLYYLNSVEFEATVPNDNNRIIDGLNLRDEFLSEQRFPGYIGGPCSMLEMLVAFSIRIELDITGDPGSDDLGRWFWVMLDNAKLLRYDDDNFDLGEIGLIVEKIVGRKYKRNGIGGFFPVFHSNKNQREVELWYQMQAYLSENFE